MPAICAGLEVVTAASLASPHALAPNARRCMKGVTVASPADCMALWPCDPVDQRPKTLRGPQFLTAEPPRIRPHSACLRSAATEEWRSPARSYPQEGCPLSSIHRERPSGAGQRLRHKASLRSQVKREVVSQPERPRRPHGFHPGALLPNTMAGPSDGAWGHSCSTLNKHFLSA